jgi:hypothetical protein
MPFDAIDREPPNPPRDEPDHQPPSWLLVLEIITAERIFRALRRAPVSKRI